MKITVYEFVGCCLGKALESSKLGVLKLIWEGRLMFLLLILSAWEAVKSLSSYYPHNQAGSLESGGKERSVMSHW